MSKHSLVQEHPSYVSDLRRVMSVDHSEGITSLEESIEKGKVILAKKTLTELKAQAWDQWQDCEELLPVLDSIEDMMKSIGARYVHESVLMYGVKTPPREALCYYLILGGFNRKEFFELLDKHITI